MAGGYSRTVKITVAGGVKSCHELPMPPRGVLDRLIIVQTAGTSAAADFKIYDRKGACEGETDLNVAESGTVSTVQNNGGFASVTTGANHNLKVGDTIEIKGCDVADYNTTHTVTEVTSETVVVTDVSYTSDGTGGVWQTTPFMETHNPAGHVVHSGSVTSGSPLQEFDLERNYENRDNQSETMRTRHSALWLEFDSGGGGGSEEWEVAYTAESDML